MLEIKDEDKLPEYHRNWVEEIIQNRSNHRDAKWTESIAVGDKEFATEKKAKLGIRAIGRQFIPFWYHNDIFVRQDCSIAYEFHSKQNLGWLFNVLNGQPTVGRIPREEARLAFYDPRDLVDPVSGEILALKDLPEQWPGRSLAWRLLKPKD